MRKFIPNRQAVGSFATGAAWFFIVVSLMHLGWVVSVMMGSPDMSTAKLYHTVVDGVSYDALFMTYTGVTGLGLAILQGLVVIGAAVTSTLKSPRMLKPRRIGHAVLCAWATLWVLNLAWLYSVDGQFSSLVTTAVMGVLATATYYRAFTGWTPKSRKPASLPPQDEPVEPIEPTPPQTFTRQFFEAVYASARREPAAEELWPEPAPKPATVMEKVKTLWLRVVAWFKVCVTRCRRVTSATLQRVADTARRGADRIAPATNE